GSGPTRSALRVRTDRRKPWRTFQRKSRREGNRARRVHRREPDGEDSEVSVETLPWTECREGDVTTWTFEGDDADAKDAVEAVNFMTRVSVLGPHWLLGQILGLVLCILTIVGLAPLFPPHNPFAILLLDFFALIPLFLPGILLQYLFAKPITRDTKDRWT